MGCSNVCVVEERMKGGTVCVLEEGEVRGGTVCVLEGGVVCVLDGEVRGGTVCGVCVRVRGERRDSVCVLEEMVRGGFVCVLNRRVSGATGRGSIDTHSAVTYIYCT